jgi:ureidoglycolate hydrolase
MTDIVHAIPITGGAIAPYGGLIATDIINDKTILVNGGTARRTPEVVPTQNLYAVAPSKIPARAVLNVSLASPRDVTSSSVNGMAKKILKIGVLERHKYTTQSFIPMGSNVKYLVVVTDGIERPNLEGLKAFVAEEKQGVCYGAGVWHAPLSVVDNVSSYPNLHVKYIEIWRMDGSIGHELTSEMNSASIIRHRAACERRAR